MAAVTWNPSDKSNKLDLSNGDLRATKNAVGDGAVRATLARNSGKWYWEVKVVAGDSGYDCVGIGTSSATLDNFPGADSAGYGYRGDHRIWHSNTESFYGETYGLNDIIGVALNLDNGKIWFSKNGSWLAAGDPVGGANYAYNGISGTFYPMYSAYGSTDAGEARFTPVSQSYSPPDGYNSLDPGVPIILLDGKIAINSPIDSFDGKARIKDSKSSLLDGKACINTPTIFFNGKTRIRNVTLNSLDSKVRIKDSAINLFDTKTKIKDSTSNFLDGRVHPVLSTANSLDGKVILYPVLNGNILFPLFGIETIVGQNAFLDDSFSAFEVEAFSGKITNLTFPFFTLDGIAKVGEVLSTNLTLPSLTLEALTGINGLATFPLLECNVDAIVGNIVNSNIGLPLVKLNAEALVNIISKFEASFPELQIDAKGLAGILVTGNSNLYPLHLISNSKAGPLASTTISLPCLIVNGDLAHQITGIINVEFPMISLFANVATLTKGCEILRYKRWR